MNEHNLEHNTIKHGIDDYEEEKKDGNSEEETINEKEIFNSLKINLPEVDWQNYESQELYQEIFSSDEKREWFKHESREKVYDNLLKLKDVNSLIFWADTLGFELDEKLQNKLIGLIIDQEYNEENDISYNIGQRAESLLSNIKHFRIDEKNPLVVSWFKKALMDGQEEITKNGDFIGASNYHSIIEYCKLNSPEILKVPEEKNKNLLIHWQRKRTKLMSVIQLFMVESGSL